jgi:hypothetical protein
VLRFEHQVNGDADRRSPTGLPATGVAAGPQLPGAKPAIAVTTDFGAELATRRVPAKPLRMPMGLPPR